MTHRASVPGRDETTKGRTVSRITEPLADELCRVPIGERTGLVVGVGSIRTAFRTARKRAGLGTDVTANTLRHTFASWAVQAGVPLIKVAQALGHRSTQMVERHYGHLAPEHLDEAAEATGLSQQCGENHVHTVFARRRPHV